MRGSACSLMDKAPVCGAERSGCTGSAPRSGAERLHRFREVSGVAIIEAATAQLNARLVARGALFLHSVAIRAARAPQQGLARSWVPTRSLITRSLALSTQHGKRARRAG